MEDEDQEDEVARARRIIREAHETVARTRDIGKQKRNSDATANLPPDELAKTLIGVEGWRQRAEERERQRALAKAELVSSRQVDWSSIDERIEAHLSQERTMMSEVVGSAIRQLLDDEHREIMREHREEIRELKIEISKLGSEVAELRALLATERSVRAADASVIRRVN